MARNARQSKILELIADKEIETQEELVGELLKSGYEVTQATVSRDIKDLGLVKVSVDGKRQRYTREKSDTSVTSKFTDLFRHSFVSVDYAGNIVVVKMLAGSGNIAGARIDREKNPKVLGCVAGDDTVFAVLRDEESAKIMVEQLREIAYN